MCLLGFGGWNYYLFKEHSASSQSNVKLWISFLKLLICSQMLKNMKANKYFTFINKSLFIGEWLTKLNMVCTTFLKWNCNVMWGIVWRPKAMFVIGVIACYSSSSTQSFRHFQSLWYLNFICLGNFWDSDLDWVGMFAYSVKRILKSLTLISLLNLSQLFGMMYTIDYAGGIAPNEQDYLQIS